MTRFQPTRRDPRFTLGESAGDVSIPLGEDGPTVAPLLSVSVAGVAFAVDEATAGAIERGDRLSPATIRVGRCSVLGALAVRNVHDADGRRELGCHFIPEGDHEEARWMALLEGIEAALAG